MNKFITIGVAAVIVVGGGAFYGGMKYAEGRSPRGQFSRADIQNLSPEERQQRLQGLGANAGAGFRMGMGGGTGNRGGFVVGEIISKDDKSVTVKLNDGGSKIIFTSDSTKVTKSAEGSLADVQVGTQILANGTPNQDGSITAKTIQLSPELPMTQMR